MLRLVCVVLAVALSTTAMAQSRTVIASTYGEKDKLVATGARFNKNKMAVAHRTLDFGTWLTLTRGRHVAVVVVNDRGPFVRGRELDLTYAANRALMCGGLCRVHVELWKPPLPKPRPDIPEPAIAWGEEE